SDYAWSAALAGDKIVVTGQDKDAAIVLIRLNANGTLDKSFNGTGRVVDPVGRQMGFLSQVAQKDGSIVVAGDQFPGVLVARYTAAGKLDKSFGTNGHVTFGWNDHYGYDNGLPKKILLMPDGRLIIAGDTNAPNGPGEFGALHYDYALE